jgi:LDH2 family malate/lactate/ureidoglycolate dehydrogenase
MSRPLFYFSVQYLTSLASRIFEKAGLSSAHARIEADNLVYAERRGHSAHGVTRIPIYTRRLLCGAVNHAPNIRVESRSASAAIVHGDNGPGAVVSDAAMKAAIALARKTGIGMVVARGSNHNGPCAFYSTQASDCSLIGVSATNAPVSMAVWGSRGRALGTNPFSFAIPAGNHPSIVIDMASSMVARGKIVEAAKRGEQIPEGLALSAEGAPTTDAKTAEAGVMLPFAGPKGSGIAVLVDLVSGVLSGASFGSLVNNLYSEFQKPQDNGHFFMAIDPALFMPRQEFLSRVDQYIALLKSTPLAQGFSEVLMPGEPELLQEATCKRTGISLPENVVADIRAVCVELDLPMDEGSPKPLPQP